MEESKPEASPPTTKQETTSDPPPSSVKVEPKVPEPAKTNGDASASNGGRRANEAQVKPEFKLSRFLPISLPSPQPGEGGGGDDEETSSTTLNGGKKKNKGRNKKRPRDAIHQEADGLCRGLILHGACKWGDDCRFSHDVQGYLKRKEKDIGPMCPLYAAFGHCPTGLTCRWGSSHLSPEGVNQPRTSSIKGEGEGSLSAAVQAPPAVLLEEENEFSTSMIVELQKGRYPFVTPRFRDVQQQARQQKKKEKNVKREKEIKKETPATTATVPAVTSAAALPAEGQGEAKETEIADDAAVVKEEEGGTEKVEHDVPTAIAATTTPTSNGTTKAVLEFDPSTPLPEKEKKAIDFSNKIYIAPLTTVGNLPFRRVMKDLGADITCGEMAVATNILSGRKSELALLRRHPCEDIFGVQLAGAHEDVMARTAEVLKAETIVEFIDLNLGCPIDLINNQGMGAALMQRTSKLKRVVNGMSKVLQGSIPITIKMRTGWADKQPTAHILMRQIQKWGAGGEEKDELLPGGANVAAVFVHGRSRQQRYTKRADWDYVKQVAKAQDPNLPRIPVIGNGDILHYTDYEAHKAAYAGSLEPCAMLGRGALIKPWLPTEIKEQRHWDISASERLDILRKFVNYGLEHWGSDQRGVNSTRRFLLEWLSFSYRYVPVGLLEHPPIAINDRPMAYRGRNDLESLLASPFDQDWIKISEMLLGPVPHGFEFAPKHKANGYEGANG